MRLYVYYKVPQARLDDVVRAAHAMQAGLRQQFAGLQCALLRRPELRDGEVTVMETYEGTVPPALEAHLVQAAATLPQPRHTERFIGLG